MQGNPLVNILPVIILAVFLYFVMIRPQSKRQKKVNDENVVLELLPDFHKVMIRKQSIVKVITAQDEEADATAEAEEPKASKAVESQDQTAAEQPEATDTASES